MKAKMKVPAVKKPTVADKLLAENRELAFERDSLAVRVADLQCELCNLKAAAEAGKHKKPGHCKHCGRHQIDHFYYTAKCRPHGDVRFEAAQ